MPNQKLVKNLIFPVDTPDLISEILKRYNLQESPEEILIKFEKGEKINGEIVADLIKKTVAEEISFSELISSLKTSFEINQKDAENLAKDLVEEIILQAGKPSEAPLTITEEKEGTEPKRKDPYREPIE